MNAFNRKDVLAGGIVVLVGVLCTLEALSYSMGTATSMGPGYFPFLLGILLVVLGIAVAVIDARAIVRDEGEPFTVSWRALVALPASILVFAAIIERFGLAPATFLAVLVSTLADKTSPLWRGVMLSAAVTALCVLIFRFGLGMQVRTFIW